MLRLVKLLAAVLLLSFGPEGIAGTPAKRDGGEPSMDDLRRELSEAYQNTRTCLCTKTTYMMVGDGVKKYPVESKEIFALDRVRGGLRFEYISLEDSSDGIAREEPGPLVVCDGTRLWHRDPRLAQDRHVEMKIVHRPSYAWLMLIASPMDGWTSPHIPALLGEDPLDVIERHTKHPDGLRYEAVPARSSDSQGRLGLRVVGFTEGSRWGSRNMTFWLDNGNHLITQVTTDLGQGKTCVMDIDIQSHNQPLDPNLFAFRADESRPVPSRLELGGRQQHPLLGRAAPPIMLKTLNGESLQLSQVKADVVVLNFWATWCAFCIDKMPDLQLLHDWTKKHEKSVAIYAVNIKESPEQIREAWNKMKLDVPVAMDSEAAMMAAYSVEGLPATFVLYRGRIVYAAPAAFEGLKLVIDYLTGPDGQKDPIP